MVANDTNANRKTVITFIGAENKQEIIEMNSDVETKRDESNNHYCYHMTLEHKGRYDILLQGHLQGNLKKTLSVQTNIHYKKKMLKTDGDAPVKSNTGDLSIQDGTNKKHCTIFELDEWKTEINLTVDASPVFVSGQSRPNGIEFIWHLDVLYPDCNSESMIISDGAIGSNLRNVFEDFRYWFRNNVAMISTSQILPKIYDMAFNAEYLKRHHFDYHFLFNGPGLNTSYDIHSDRFLNNTGNINVNCHLESDWKLFNFDYCEIYVIVYKGSEMDVSRVDHSLDAKCAIFDVSIDSILVKDESGLAVVQDGFIHIRYPILSGRTNISSQVTLSKKSRSGVNVKLTRNEMDYHMDVAIHSPKAIDTSFSLKQPNGPKVFVVSFLSELVGSTSKETTIQWNPVFTQRGIEILKAKQLQLSNALSTASETLTKNLGKSISSMVIPFVNETVGYVVSKVAVPIVHYLPLPKSIKTMMTANLHQHSKTNLGNAVKNEGTQEEIQNDDNRIVYFGQMLCDFVTKLQSNLLYMMSRLLIEPPAAVTNMVKMVLKPNLHEALRTNKFSFIQPLLLKWKHFMSLPTLTKGLQYIYGLIKTRYGPQQIESGVKTALLYDKSEILTFDGKLYQMKDSSTCPHLLTADVKHGNFAVVVSNDGITVLTRTSMATIHRGGQVFINSCNQPINFPYNTEELHIIKKNVSRVITLDYGLTISCDINNNHCNFGLRHHHNETIGLLGNNDGEIGNDFKLSKSEITLNTDQFVKSYELAESQSCVPPVVNMLSQVKACDDLQKKCVNLFNTASSPLAVCFLKVDPAPFSESCQERVKNCMPYSVCPSVHAYISKCDIAGVIIEASEQLDTCKETYPTAGEIPPKALLDIVIILYKDKNDSFCLPCIETFVRFLQTCDKIDVEITFTQIDSEQLSLNEALMKSTHHHFRLHTQKIVTVIKADQDLSEEEYQILKDSYLNKDILLNVISHYKILRHRGIVGLDWDNEIIAVNKILDETKELPQDFLIKLMSQTKGALFNANFLEKNMKTRMAGLVKHICERQAYSSTKC